MGHSARAVFIDAGGTIVLPDRKLVAGALGRVGIEVDPAAVPRAHYRAVRTLDRAPYRAARTADPYPASGAAGAYGRAICAALGVPLMKLEAALAAFSELANRDRSREILWSEPTPGALETMATLARTGIAVLVVTNSDGHAAENLRDAGILAGAGLSAETVIDSTVVGSAKPDPAIFEVALRRAGVGPTEAVHVGDMLSSDIVGARAAGIRAIHLDPSRACRSPEHPHVRSLLGIWKHVRPTS